MAQTKYTYSITDDTANAKLAADALKKEIEDSSIVIALDYIAALGDILDVYMKDSLSTGDETTLNNTVSAHTGVGLDADPETVTVSNETPVHTFALAEGSNLRARLIGIHKNATATKNTITNIDWEIPQVSYLGQNKQTYMDGIIFKATDSVDGDRMSFQVVDVDGDVYPAGTVLDEFGKDWPVIPDEKEIIRLYKAKLIPGFYIRIVYDSIGTTNDVKLNVGIFRHMDTSEDI